MTTEKSNKKPESRAVIPGRIISALFCGDVLRFSLVFIIMNVGPMTRKTWNRVLKMDKQRLYDMLCTIPRGKVVTYGMLAEMLGNRAWARAVGNALHSNPDGEKYPCYKVVNSKGELSRAYAFGGIDEQKRRLEKDGIALENGKVDLKVYGYRVKENDQRTGSRSDLSCREVGNSNKG